MGNFRRSWEKYRLLRNQYLVVFFVFLAFVCVYAVLLVKHHRENKPLFFVIAIPLVFLLTYTHERFLAFVCPRCGKRFDRRSRFGFGGFTKKCVYCGLSKYSS
jgi:hypothetical protein